MRFLFLLIVIIVVETKEDIKDRMETNLVNLRRVVYLTIMNALNYEEAVHKLLKVQIDEGKEVCSHPPPPSSLSILSCSYLQNPLPQIEMANMIIECCSQERSCSTFYGLIGKRFCKLNRVWTESFETAFGNYYKTVH